jgi:hypothetical protein
MNVPVEIARRIELTRTLDWERPRPIATPIEVEIANENIKPNALPNEKPERTKLPPNDKDATQL